MLPNEVIFTMAKLIIDDQSFDSEKPKNDYISFRTIINDDTLSSSLYKKGTSNIQKMKMSFIKLINNQHTWDLNIFKDGRGNYFFHIKVPSEKVKGLFYDVVIKSEVPSDKKRVTINNNPIKVYSNSPSFLFQYAYVCNKYGLIIDELIPKIGDIALSTPPKSKNPLENFGFEKSIYYACMYLKYNQLTHIQNLDANVRLANIPAYLDKEVKSCQAKLKEYNSVKDSNKPFFERYKTKFRKIARKLPIIGDSFNTKKKKKK